MIRLINQFKYKGKYLPSIHTKLNSIKYYFTGLLTKTVIDIPSLGSGWWNFLKIKFIKLINIFLLIINLRKNFINKNLGFTFLFFIIVGIISSLAIRFDYFYNLLNNLSLSNKIIIISISSIYSSYLIMLTIYNLKQSKLFINYYSKLNNKIEHLNILIPYILLTLFLSYISIILCYINYLYLIKLKYNWIN